mgnify:FL=1
MAISYRPDIDGLRAVAVVPVVLGHAGLPGFAGGFVGVDVFFVISGFLITALLHDELREGRFSLAEFYLRRIRRLLPALFTVLVATVLMGWLLLPPKGLEALGQSVLSVLMLGSNVWLWQNTGNYFGAAAEITPLLHTWSLAVEEQFYLIFPILLIGLLRFPNRTAAFLLLFLTGAGFLGAWEVTGKHPTAAFYLMPARAWEFGVGALLAIAPARLGHRVAAVAVGTGLAMIFGAVIAFDAGTEVPGYHALLPVFGAALVIAGGVRENSVSKVLGSTAFVAIGLLSYSLYLWHWPVQVGLRLLTGIYHLPIVLGLVSIAISFALAYLTRRWVEEPMRRHRSLPVTAAVLTPICVSLLCLSVAAFRSGGAPARIPSDVLAVYETATQAPALHADCMSRGAMDAPCTLNFPQRVPRVLVWGDSHAGAALPAFSEWAIVTGRPTVAATKAGCPPILGVNRSDRASEHGCAAKNAALMAWLRQNRSVETIIMHARWPLMLTGGRTPGEAGGEFRLASSDGQRIEAASALSATVSNLRMMGKRVVLIGSVPELGLDLPQAYLAHSRTLGRWSELDLPHDPMPRSASADAALARIAKKHGAEFISLRAPDETAQDLTSLPLLYADDDHLSPEGARQLVLPALMNALPASQPQSPPIAVLSSVRKTESAAQLFGPH